ncbi:MAG: flagellar motor switch protein FliG [Myxococcota bacterium]|nr:flagellar motor switch protein FliG [Myxococcota bacterium]
MSAAMDTATMAEEDNANGQAETVKTDTPTAPMGRAGSKGARKAAIAMMMLGPELASEILRVLGDNEVKILLETARQISHVPEEEAVQILEAYTNYVEGRSLLVPRTDDFVSNVAAETLGDDQVRRILGLDPSAEPTEEDSSGEDVLSDIESVDASAEVLSSVLQKEHPQTVAVALAVMSAEKSGEVLTRLPEDLQSEVVRRIAVMQSVSPDLLREVSDTLRSELDASLGSTIQLDGQSVAVNVLKTLSSDAEETVFQGLTEMDPELSEAIRKQMFVFEDLLEIDSRALQMMLKEIDGRTLTLGLKTASTALRDHLLSSMSTRAATMILEDLEAMGPVAISQVEQAQDEIVQVALRLAAEGKIQLR